MSDEATATTTVIATAETQAAPAARRCPWCSESLPVDATVRCPHCHANLVAEGDTRLPGLTEVEAPSAAKARRADAPKRSKLLSWISGDIDDEPAPIGGAGAPAEALALPPRDVRREMLRLQLEAEGLTVTADGSIELPTDATLAGTSVVAAAADAVVEPATAEAPAEIRKAS